MKVAAAPGGVGYLAEQQRPAVPEAGRVAAELMAGVGLRDRLGAVGQRVTGKQRGAVGAAQRGVVQPQFGGEMDMAKKVAGGKSYGLRARASRSQGYMKDTGISYFDVAGLTGDSRGRTEMLFGRPYPRPGPSWPKRSDARSTGC